MSHVAGDRFLTNLLQHNHTRNNNPQGMGTPLHASLAFPVSACGLAHRKLFTGRIRSAIPPSSDAD